MFTNNAKFTGTGAEMLVGGFIARAAEHYAAGELREWAACLRLAGEFATDALPPRS